MRVDFYVYEPSGPTLHLPLNPEQVSITSGARMQSFSVLDLGEVAIPRGNTPARISFDTLLPGRARQSDAWFKGWRDPLEYVAVLGRWKANGTRVRLLVTGTQIGSVGPEGPFGWELFIEAFDHTERGGHGDVSCSLSFVEAKTIRVLTDQEAATAGGIGPGLERPLPPKLVSWTVTEADIALGDGWLGGSAKRVYGTWERWSDIYFANQDVIGPDSGVPAPAGTELVTP
ncbi:MAG TPA: hypothetical protein VNM48_00210 [Chloroflexota bacterium]|nr:hypothetical protein [Chloroflexota bacterium]